MRDDFNSDVKMTIAARVGYRCSNPECRRLTSGPQVTPNKSINIGVAAHITAAANGGPRYSASMSSPQRSGIGNAIWLCQTCAKLVDNDPKHFSSALLRRWKGRAEAAAKRELVTAVPDVELRILFRCYRLGNLLEHIHWLLKESLIEALVPLEMALALAGGDECENVIWTVAEDVSKLSPRALNELYGSLNIRNRTPDDYALFVTGLAVYETWSEILLVLGTPEFSDEIRDEVAFYRAQSYVVMEKEIRTLAKVATGGVPDNSGEKLRYQFDAAMFTLAVMLRRTLPEKSSLVFLCGAALARIRGSLVCIERLGDLYAKSSVTPGGEPKKLWREAMAAYSALLDYTADLAIDRVTACVSSVRKDAKYSVEAVQTWRHMTHELATLFDEALDPCGVYIADDVRR